MKTKKLAAGITALALSVTALVTPLSESFTGILDGLFDKISYSADAETYGDYEFFFHNEEKEITITGYTGTCENLIIPSEINGYPIEVLGDMAFENCLTLKSVIISDGVNYIGMGTFAKCSNLETISIPNSVIALDESAFESCSSLSTIIIPQGVKKIGQNVFADCTRLISVTIPSSVTSIGYSAFELCSSLESITIPDSVKYIGESAFYECMSLKDVYYTGTENEWNSIDIEDYNDCLTNATIHYNHKHSYASSITTPATCTTDGIITYTCECGDTYTEAIKATGHTYTTKVVAPTYAAQGYTLHTCSVCGESYKDNYTAQLVLGNVSGLKMTANTPTSISMSWNKVSGATGYVVYQAIDGKWQRIKVTSGNTLTVSNLKAGTNYRFTVKAYKTVEGKNYYSPSYTGVWMTTTPAKPAAKMTVNTAQAIRLEWGKVTGATGYVVYQQVNGSWVRKAVTKNNVYVEKGLKSGTNYNFAVRAYRTFNGKNYYSPFATATDTIKTCTKPATVSFTLTAGTKKATVKWNKVTGATGYIVYYKTSANGSWQRLTTTTGTSYTKTGLASGKTYYFTVKAYKTYNGKTYNASYTTKSVKVK